MQRKASPQSPQALRRTAVTHAQVVTDACRCRRCRAASSTGTVVWPGGTAAAEYLHHCLQATTKARGAPGEAPAVLELGAGTGLPGEASRTGLRCHRHAGTALPHPSGRRDTHVGSRHRMPRPRAGLVAAKAHGAAAVVTDGNVQVVEMLRETLAANGLGEHPAATPTCCPTHPLQRKGPDYRIE